MCCIVQYFNEASHCQCIRLFTYVSNVRYSSFYTWHFIHMWHESFWTNFLCHLQDSHEKIIKIYIYTLVTLESLNKFTWSLVNCTQGLSKFVRLLVSCMRVLNKFAGPLISCMQAHDLMHLWSALLARSISRCVQNTRVATAPLNRASTNTPRSVLTLLTVASTTASHLPVSSRLFRS